jgi:DnaJ-class molecular chaperone
MDELFDRLGRLIRSVISDSDDFTRSYKSGDEDYADAWDELNAFLNEDDKTGSTQTKTESVKDFVPRSLEKDFEQLQVPFGTNLENCKKAYKILMKAYHPDRHSGDPAKLKEATKISMAVNESFSRIEEFYEKGVSP